MELIFTNGLIDVYLDHYYQIIYFYWKENVTVDKADAFEVLNERDKVLSKYAYVDLIGVMPKGLVIKPQAIKEFSKKGTDGLRYIAVIDERSCKRIKKFLVNNLRPKKPIKNKVYLGFVDNEGQGLEWILRQREKFKV